LQSKTPKGASRVAHPRTSKKERRFAGGSEAEARGEERVRKKGRRIRERRGGMRPSYLRKTKYRGGKRKKKWMLLEPTKRSLEKRTGEVSHDLHISRIGEKKKASCSHCRSELIPKERGKKQRGNREKWKRSTITQKKRGNTHL